MRELGEAELTGVGDYLDKELRQKGEILSIPMFLTFGD